MLQAMVLREEGELQPTCFPREVGTLASVIWVIFELLYARMHAANKIWFMCVCCAFVLHPSKLYQKNGDVLMACKAYNGRVVMQWLAETVAGLAEPFASQDDRTPVVALAMNLTRITKTHI